MQLDRKIFFSLFYTKEKRTFSEHIPDEINFTKKKMKAEKFNLLWRTSEIKLFLPNTTNSGDFCENIDIKHI